ncbi:hypothetical protein [Fodinibius saliphilus]|uniref:hypothetical protein n=1 Tax=Fodinibius saliphilus TaxID=1920650 RepID=UPI001108A689|nr:hypothetical protein [Fodinibius saliphilus]
MENKIRSRIDSLWKVSVACFIIAGLTGFLYRLGMIGWLTSSLDLSLENIRHAHSHLMFFGWAVPIPLYLLLKYICDNFKPGISSLGWMKYGIWGGLIFGVLSFPFFLLYGYRPVPIGAGTLPLSVILSGMVMLCWYMFMWGYYQIRDQLKDDTAQPWFDGSLVMLFICSLGAWSVAVVQALAPENFMLMKGMTHFFLATFTEGWVVLALLAIVVIQLDIQPSDWVIPETWSLGCIVIGAPLTFPYGISESLLSPLLLAVARIGGGIAALGLVLFLYVLVKSGKWKYKIQIWIWPISLIALKAVMQITASIGPSSFWLADHGLRIFYLHVLLLGAFTLMMLGSLHVQSEATKSYFYAVVGSIYAVLISLVMPTQLWPTSWSGVWVFYVLAVAALLPVLAVSLQWITLRNVNTNRTDARY